MERIILKIRAYSNKHRKKVRTIKAIIALTGFSFAKYHIGADIDTIFLLLGIWYFQEIKW